MPPALQEGTSEYLLGTYGPTVQKYLFVCKGIGLNIKIH